MSKCKYMCEYEYECDLGALIDAALSRTHESESESVRMSAAQTSRSMDLKRTCAKKRAIATHWHLENPWILMRFGAPLKSIEARVDTTKF